MNARMGDLSKCHEWDYVTWLTAVEGRLASGMGSMGPLDLFTKHLLTVIAVKKTVAFTSALAKLFSVSYHCEEQKQESMLGRILSKKPTITKPTTTTKQPAQISLNQCVYIHLYLSSLCTFIHGYI